MQRILPGSIRYRVYLLAGAIMVALSLCLFFGISTMRDMRSYFEMLRGSHHPIWQDLALKRISKGTLLEHVIVKWKPQRIHQNRADTTLTYWWPDEPNICSSYIGITVMAKDRILTGAIAWSCTAHHVFFGDENFSTD